MRACAGNLVIRHAPCRPHAVVLVALVSVGGLASVAGVTAGNMIYFHDKKVFPGNRTTVAIGSALKEWNPASDNKASSGVTVSGSTGCLNTGETTGFRMQLDENGTRVAWACYITTSGSTTAEASLTVQRGINTLSIDNVITTTPIAAGAYAGGLMRAAVYDGFGGFYVSEVAARAGEPL